MSIFFYTLQSKQSEDYYYKRPVGIYFLFKVIGSPWIRLLLIFFQIFYLLFRALEYDIYNMISRLVVKASQTVQKALKLVSYLLIL